MTESPWWITLAHWSHGYSILRNVVVAIASIVLTACAPLVLVLLGQPGHAGRRINT